MKKEYFKSMKEFTDYIYTGGKFYFFHNGDDLSYVYGNGCILYNGCRVDNIDITCFSEYFLFPDKDEDIKYLKSLRGKWVRGKHFEGYLELDLLRNNVIVNGLHFTIENFEKQFEIVDIDNERE